MLLACAGALALTSRTAVAAERNVPTPYATIQAAVSAAATGDEIVIAPGVYTGDGNRDIVLPSSKQITIRSSNPSDPAVVRQTVIDCGGSPADPHRAFALRYQPYSGPVVVAGLTIINGYPRTETLAAATADSGGAIFIANCSPIIRDCTIEACGAVASGGGIYVSSGSPSILRCTFRDCGGDGVTGGAIFAEAGSVKINNCLFAGNSAASGGAIGLRAGTPALADCTFEDNAGQTGGAVHVQSTTLPISACTFVGNTAGQCGGAVAAEDATVPVGRCRFRDNLAGLAGGGLYGRASGLSLSNSLLLGNRASLGGALHGDAGGLSLAHCTLAGNRARSEGGGLYAANGCIATVLNTILWGDSAPAGPEVALQSGSSLAISYSDVQGDWPAVLCPADCSQTWGDGCFDRGPTMPRRPSRTTTTTCGPLRHACTPAIRTAATPARRTWPADCGCSARGWTSAPTR
jgi:hypothetical protein